MKKKILFSMCATLLLLASCDYNEDNFPGYDELANATDVQNVTLTLEDTEYKTIASLPANKELAASKDSEGETTYASALEAVGKNKFFTEDALAAWYLPAYISDKYPYLSDGSKMTVNYNNFEELPEYLKDFNSVSTYELTSDDYKTVWGDAVSASFLSPSTVRQIPNLLAEAVKNPADGAMRLVNYAYSETEPSTGGGGEEPEPTYTNIADAISAGAGKYDVKGEVVAANSRSILVKDDTGIIMVYLNALPSFSLGDVVTVSGDISSYYGAPFQFSKEAKVTVVDRKTTFAYPTSPKNMSATDMDAYLTTQPVEYVTYEGTLTISDGKYFNVAVEGTTTAVGRVQYPIAIDNAWVDQKVKVTGYAVGASSSKYVNTIATSVVPVGSSETTAIPVGLIALSQAGTYKTRGVVAATYTRGFMLTDGTGSILVYENKVPTSKIGDIVSVTGTTSSYNGLMQFGTTGLQVEKESEGNISVNGLIAQNMDGADVDAYVAAPRAVYVAYTGTLIIKDSGSYNSYSVEVDGTTVGVNFSYVDETTIDAGLNNTQVIVKGYLIGSKPGTVYTMVNTVTAATADNVRAFGMTRAAGAKPTTSAVYRYDVATDKWKAYTTTAASVAVLQPADYTAIGSSYVSKPAETLPIYLKQNYPYAKKDDIKVVVYYTDSNLAVAATEFVYDGAVWTQTTVATPSTIIFLKSQGEWAEAKVYYSSSLLNGDDGGFTVQNVELSDLSNVWTLDKVYGWKGTGYSGSNKVTDSWLISPEISLKKSAVPVLKFDIAINYLRSGELANYLNVMISTNYDGGDVADADWTELTVEGMPAGDSWTFSTVTPVDLSAYKEQNVHIAFRYRSDAAVATTTEIKNMSVQE